MELFNKNVLYKEIKYGFGQTRALLNRRIGVALVFSMATHALFLSLNTDSSKNFLLSLQPIRIVASDANIRFKAKPSNTLVNQVLKETELLRMSSKTTTGFDQLPIAETFQKSTFATQNVINLMDDEAMQGPVKGLAMGSAGFTGFGGGRKKAFEFANANANSPLQNINGDSQETFLRRQMVEALLAELKNDLNQLLPLDSGQKCQLQEAVVCKKRNEFLEKYLLMKAPLIQQLVAGKVVSVTTEDGQWKIELTN